ncbi:DUF6525 family protein [Brevundimonas sp.]|jgi:hypothetical protein|uniref:DUF6525 family protein n=1 Tax=Brevundimonas sp. TaxID=1871086 RepID=UPI00121E5EBF|nr:DUF6525 family protein [Brevundimonas sp.]MCG2662885.1 DUF6525 family protein [Brevundimonas sp.]TAJ46039.1 MAG: hypothetical protein EPO54_06155 [Brevundimonas sp.]
MSDNGFNRLGLGVCPTTPDADMAAFDALPPLVRARLRDAPIKVASAPLLRFWRSDVGDAAARHQALISALDSRISEIAA